MRARIEPLPGIAAVAGAHDEAVLPAQVAVLGIRHLDAEDREIGAELDAFEMEAAILGQEQLAARADDKCALGTGRPYIEENVVKRDAGLDQRRNFDLPMTRRHGERSYRKDQLGP